MMDYLVTFVVKNSSIEKKIIVTTSDKLNEQEILLYSEIRIFNTCTNLGIRSYKDFKITEIKKVGS